MRFHGAPTLSNMRSNMNEEEQFGAGEKGILGLAYGVNMAIVAMFFGGLSWLAVDSFWLGCIAGLGIFLLVVAK